MNQKQLAKKLGISQGFLSKIYNGKACPSYNTAERWRPLTGWGYHKWRQANVQQVQKLLNRIGG